MGIFIVLWIVCACIGYAIGQPKGRGGEGLALGLLLGFIGLIIIAVLRPTPEFQARENLRIADEQARLTGVSPPYAAGSANLQTELRQLQSLHAEGVLTDDEYASAKRRLLGI